ncbi:RagB/SusD family nutrient uptake outer membrane protein [Pedobacter mucosus]|uniref:RagB/SusD family nutrient uptake outer membrane protein n=1 Tax=Pedobacter mucosus TaxID=2895286 RepID=UPI001EE3ABB2|nr:RagB/SusD family nutrient uptake outer membrane protein [Pedobacter mucosus]UKT62762.1 RagB/SusD family nutrient uptake outer membrane protein [Pedobacter mucosus]
MKNLKCIVLAALFCTVLSCKKGFIEGSPQGQLIADNLATQDGVEALLTGAYGLLNGNQTGTWGNYGAAPSQWLFGEVASDNAHKGSSNGDQPNMNLIEQHSPTSTNDNLANIWDRCFEGILRCNNTIKILTALQASGAGKFSDSRAAEIQGEARLLRAHYYFFLVRVFKSVPMITEATTTAAVDNTKDIYPDIVTDLTYSVANLPTTKPKGQVGRVDKYIAQAYLGKVLLYQKKYTEAYTQLNAVIAAKPDLVTLPYTDNFDIDKENGPESVFAVQNAVGTDGTGGDNGNVGDMLNFPYAVACCGFFQPTIDLANSFKVSAAGLPLLDGSYRTNPYVSDMGLSAAAKAAYQVNTSLNFDPRIDYTLGRRGVDYRKGYGPMPGDSWIRDVGNAGPFVVVKNVLDQAQIAAGTAPGSTNVTGLNVNIIRLADIYLMAAECAVENGDLPRALFLVNKVRARAALLPPKTVVGGAPAAVYRVSPYPSFPTADYARTAVRMERRLELAMEGHRFFDLVRWGIVKQTLESYFGFEGGYFNYLKGINIEARDDYFPLPQDQIDRSQGVLKQSTGY